MSANQCNAVCTETYIPPDVGWSCLLGPIARDARPGARIVTCTDAMRDLCEQALATIGRTDVRVELRPEGITKNRT